MSYEASIASATNEELLRKVIDAQVRGGYKKWDRVMTMPKGIPFIFPDKIVVLSILLDTHGCKAVYGRTARKDHMKSNRWKFPATLIIESWHSGEGNNIRAALETAVIFLPTE